MKRVIVAFFFVFLIVSPSLYTAEIDIVSSPSQRFISPFKEPSLVNSVCFHPSKRRFVATYTQNNCLIICDILEDDEICIAQILQNPKSKLKYPQHALFSKDGNYLIVANWQKGSFSIYQADSNGAFKEERMAIINYPKSLKGFKPHGIALSPCENYLAVAFGASRLFPKGIALFRIDSLSTASVEFTLTSLIQGGFIDEGIPKGISFTFDGNHLLVTFSETNSIAIYPINWENEMIEHTPKQILLGDKTLLGRPEDCVFTKDGSSVAISNSSLDTVTFYLYDPKENVFLSDVPFFSLQNPLADLSFPHGLAFSQDGRYLAITQFGNIEMNEDGLILEWGEEKKNSVQLYKLR